MSEFEPGREPLTIVELDQDFCCNIYATSDGCGTCNANGTSKCYNTLSTCQSVPDYTLGDPLTLRFAEPRVNLPRDLNIIPLLSSVSSVPTKINVGAGDKNSSPLGQRAVVNISFNDSVHSDLLVDPYRESRDFNPLERSTFWAKWLRRNPYYQNREVRIREGYVGQNIEDMRTRHYFIEEITGPDANGKVTIKAKDILKLASNQKAKFPIQSNGILDSDVSETDTSITIEGSSIAEYDPDGDGFGTIRISDEVILWGSISEASGIVTLSSLTRGAERTEADTHDERDSVQRCIRYTDTPIVDVTREILKDGAGVPAQFIDDAAWEAEAERWLDGFNVSVLLTEPFGIQDLLSELTNQCLFYIWWDDLDQLINLRALRPVDLIGGENIFEINDEQHIIENSLSITREPTQRISRVYTYFNQLVPTESIEDKNNYKRWRFLADAEAESAEQYSEKRILEIFARWLQGDAQVITVNTRKLARYRNTPEFLSFELDAKDRQIKVADIVDVTARQFVNETGEQTPKRFQVIKINESQPGHAQRYLCQQFEFFANYGFIMRNTAPTYDSASQEDKQEGCFFSETDTGFSDGREPYRFI